MDNRHIDDETGAEVGEMVLSGSVDTTDEITWCQEDNPNDSDATQSLLPVGPRGCNPEPHGTDCYQLVADSARGSSALVPSAWPHDGHAPDIAVP